MKVLAGGDLENTRTTGSEWNAGFQTRCITMVTMRVWRPGALPFPSLDFQDSVNLRILELNPKTGSDPHS